MGMVFSQLWARMFGKKEIRMLMLGLDGAGKTTILYKLKLGEVIATVPTIGFNVETVEYKNLQFNAWDVGGQKILRNLWRHYYVNTQALVFVIDSADRERIAPDEKDASSLGSAKEEIDRLVQEDELRGVAILIFANKQDLPGAMSIREMTEILGLHRLRTHHWHIQGCCAANGEGLFDGLDWLTSVLSKRP